MLPNLKHRHFILALAYTSANWNEDTGGERTDEKVFEAVKTVFEAVPGKRVSSLVPDLSCWFDEMVEGGMEEQRSKHFTLFFNAKWSLEVRFIVEKRRQVGRWRMDSLSDNILRWKVSLIGQLRLSCVGWKLNRRFADLNKQMWVCSFAGIGK